MSELVGNTSEGTYLGKPLRTFEGVYRTRSDGGEIAIPTRLAIHSNLSRRIIVNVPGYNGVIDGYAEKYKILGHHIQSSELAAVVRTGNYLAEEYPEDINLNAALKYVEERSWEICGEQNPEIMLMGFSAGASAIAARAHEYPQVSTIILFAPSRNIMGMELISEGLAKFRGNVFIVVGEDDNVVRPEVGRIFYDLAIGASHRESFLIPDCEHNFRGEKNGRIMSEAPFYAFSKGDKLHFPDPNGGIKLYD